MTKKYSTVYTKAYFERRICGKSRTYAADYASSYTQKVSGGATEEQARQLTTKEMGESSWIDS